MAIVDLTVISGNSSDIRAPEGFTRVNQDLNQGAGGEYIYLCYKEAYTVGPFITDITFVVGDSPGVAAPAGYTKIDVDLNKGARGKYIYLCFCRGEGPPIQTPLKFIVDDTSLPAITAVPLPAPDQPATGQYSMIAQDLNQGAGGKYIYLCTRRYTETWMQQIAAHIGDRPLNRIALPGTHDSATYSLTSSSEFAPDDPGLRSTFGDTSWSRGLAFRWGRTQIHTIAEQLAAGVRSLDIRVATYNGNDDDIRITHGAWGCSVDDVIRQIDAFTRKYTREIVLVHFKYNKSGILTPGSKRSLIRRLTDVLGDRLAPPSRGAAVTPNQLWAAGQRILVLLDDWIHDDDGLTAADRALFWRTGDFTLTSSLSSTGTMDLSTLQRGQEDLLRLAPKQPAKFQRLGCCLTPDLLSTAQTEFVKQGSLYDSCAKQATPAAVRWLRNEWAEQTVNIFETDFFQLAQTVDVAILRNVRPAAVALHTRLNDFVIDVPGSNASRGVQLILYPQNLPLTKNQLWFLEPTGHIRSALDRSLVLDIPGSSRQPGTRLILWTENVPASANQLWDLDDAGYIRSRLDPTLVLDVQGASTAPETPLIVWPKGQTAADNQRFRRVVR